LSPSWFGPRPQSTVNTLKSLRQGSTGLSSQPHTTASMVSLFWPCSVLLHILHACREAGRQAGSSFQASRMACLRGSPSESVTRGRVPQIQIQIQIRPKSPTERPAQAVMVYSSALVSCCCFCCWGFLFSDSTVSRAPSIGRYPVSTSRLCTPTQVQRLI
jgi:hypothetical protein